MSDDFFTLSNGTAPKTDGKAGNDFETIPAGTQVLAAIVECKWATLKIYKTETEYQGIKATWQVLAPEELKGRKVFQKLHIGHPDVSKGDRGKSMLAAIDTNAGGKLLKKGGKPTDVDLMELCAAPMMIKVGLFGKFNFVDKVAAKGDMEIVTPEAEPETVENFDDDIAF